MTSPDKYNMVMPESDENVLCIKVHKPISKEGYSESFLPRIETMVEQKGGIKLLVYYEDYKGWEEDASKMDMEASLKYRDKLVRFALVNPPEKEIFQKKLKAMFMSGETRFFSKEDFDAALEWVRG